MYIVRVKFTNFTNETFVGIFFMCSKCFNRSMLTPLENHNFPHRDFFFTLLGYVILLLHFQ